MEVDFNLPIILRISFLIITILFIFIVFILTFLQKSKKNNKLSDKYFENLEYLLHKKESRYNILERLSEINHPESVKTIISFLVNSEIIDENDRKFIESAFITLADKKDKDGIEFMIETLNGSDFKKKIAVLSGISHLIQVKNVKEKKFIKPLITFLKETDKLNANNASYVEDAIINLYELTGKNFGKDIEKWENWYKEKIEKGFIWNSMML